MKGPHAMRSILDETISGETARIFTLWNLLPATSESIENSMETASRAPFLENYTASYIGSSKKVKRRRFLIFETCVCIQLQAVATYIFELRELLGTIEIFVIEKLGKGENIDIHEWSRLIITWKVLDH